jgi:acyl carrier protein
MTPEEVRGRIAEALNVDPDRVTMGTKAGDLEEWDSMGTMTILLMLDRDLGLQLAPNEASKLASVRGILELLTAKGKLS